MEPVQPSKDDAAVNAEKKESITGSRSDSAQEAKMQISITAVEAVGLVCCLFTPLDRSTEQQMAYMFQEFDSQDIDDIEDTFYYRIGLSILLLTLANQNVAIHNGYYLLSHMTKLTDDIGPIIDCIQSTYVGHSKRCESLFNNKLCIDQNQGNVFVDGQCINVTGKGTRVERAYGTESAVIAYLTCIYAVSSQVSSGVCHP
ncbi:hypothetical protein COOONC_02570 [Cooperia oncophora]